MHADIRSPTTAAAVKTGGHLEASSKLQLLAAEQLDILKRTTQPQCASAVPAYLGEAQALCRGRLARIAASAFAASAIFAI